MDELVSLSIDSFIYVIVYYKTNKNKLFRLERIINNTFSSYLARPPVGDDNDDIIGLSLVGMSRKSLVNTNFLCTCHHPSRVST